MSGAFKHSTDGSGLSVHRANVAFEHGLGWETLLPDRKAFGMVAFRVESLPDIGLKVVPTPCVKM